MFEEICNISHICGQVDCNFLTRSAPAKISQSFQMDIHEVENGCRAKSLGSSALWQQIRLEPLTEVTPFDSPEITYDRYRGISLRQSPAR